MMAQVQVLLVDVFLWLRVSHPGTEMIKLWFCRLDPSRFNQFYLGTGSLWARVYLSGHKIYFDKFWSLFENVIWHQVLKVQIFI